MLNVPGLNHGIDVRNPHFIAWMTAVPVVFFAQFFIFRFFNIWNFPTRRGSRGSDVMAFEITAFLCVLYLSGAGVVGWFSLFGVHDKAVLEADPFYAQSDFVVNHLAIPMMAFQGWNILFCLINKDLFDVPMIIHHTISVVSSYIGMAPFLQYFALFFFGLCELTNIPLTVVDIFRYFPELDKSYGSLNLVCKYFFAVSFAILRLVCWPYMSTFYWRRTYEEITTDTVRFPVPTYFFLVAHGFMTLLQFYWGYKIFAFLVRGHQKAAKKGQKSEAEKGH